MRKILLLLALFVLMVSVAPIAAQDDVVELRLRFYADSESETEAMQDLIERFNEEHENIDVVMDLVGYSTGILQTLPIDLEAGEGPDMARITDLGGLSEFYLDLRPLVEDASYFDENFASTLPALRPPGNEDGIFGFQNQLTVTGPFINRTLFEQAGVEVPTGEVTWEEWSSVAEEVAEATNVAFPMIMDRSGHRFAGPAISMGWDVFTNDGTPVVADDEGFRNMAELMVEWHNDGVMPPDIWVGNAGQYAAGNEQFVNGQVVFYMSGSWQIPQFAEVIGDAFDWEAIQNPCGPGACTGMPGGSAIVAFAQTEHPEEVATFMEWLASEEILREFTERSLWIPAHTGLAESELDFQTDNEFARQALSTFSAQVPDLDPLAFDLQSYAFNRVLFDSTRDRLTQAIVGELTLEEAIERVQEDVDEFLAEEAQ